MSFGLLAGGGDVEGSANSTTNGTATLAYIPTANINETSSPVPFSSYPTGQGLSTINSAWAGSAAFDPSIYGYSPPYTYSTTSTATPVLSSSSSSSLGTLPLLAALAAGAWLMFHGGKL